MIRAFAPALEGRAGGGDKLRTHTESVDSNPRIQWRNNMNVKQLSIFLENKPGHLENALKVLSDAEDQHHHPHHCRVLRFRDREDDSNQTR